MNYEESLYADGFTPIVVVSLKVEGDKLIRRAVVAPEFVEMLYNFPELAQAIRTAVEDVLELGKPPDERKMKPGVTVSMS